MTYYAGFGRMPSKKAAVKERCPGSGQPIAMMRGLRSFDDERGRTVYVCQVCRAEVRSTGNHGNNLALHKREVRNV